MKENMVRQGSPSIQGDAKESILARILALKTASLSEMQKEYSALYGDKNTPFNNKTYLWQRIAYRIQELAYGSLPESAQNKAKELACEYDPINNKALRSDATIKRNISRDRRLPIPGTLITKNYKGTDIRVKILEKGFECNGKIYRTLTAIAKEVTGSHWNGYLFFNM
jgi:hypothetical protein